MVDVVRGAAVAAGRRQRASQSIAQLVPQPRQTPFRDEKCQPAPSARIARSVIAIDADQFGDTCNGLVRLEEHVERRGDGESARTHLAADEHVEAGASAGRGRHQRDVLRLAVGAILEAAGNRDVKFAWQIGKFGIAHATDNPAIEREDNRRRIEQFVRRDPGERASVDVADVVHAGLQAGQVHAPQPLPDLFHRVEGEAAELDLLSGGEVEHAVAEARRQVGDGAELLAGREPVRHPDAEHESAGRARAGKEPEPLEKFLVGLRQRVEPAGDVPRDRVADAERVAADGRLGGFDGIGALAHASGGARYAPCRGARPDTQLFECFRPIGAAPHAERDRESHNNVGFQAPSHTNVGWCGPLPIMTWSRRNRSGVTPPHIASAGAACNAVASRAGDAAAATCGGYAR